MEKEIQQLVAQIHQTPAKMVVVVAGAGSGALSWLLGVPGASRTLLEGTIPYANSSFDEFLGQHPSQYVSAFTARLLAGRALTRSRWLQPEEKSLVGVACTATIVTDRPKRGEHRAHVATWTATHITEYLLHLDKGARDRMGEEDVVSRLIINAIAQSCGLTEELSLDLTSADSLTVQTTSLTDQVDKLLAGKMAWFGIEPEGVSVTTPPTTGLLLSGSFNPLHDGHLALARAAAEMTGRSVAFEITAVNADKPPLPAEIVLDRLAQFAGRWPVLVSLAPTFKAKAQLYPGCTFVVGYDTAVRILQPRFYSHDRAEMIAALESIQAQGCHFLVAGRVDQAGQYHDATHLQIPDGFTNLFAPIASGRFRYDISSTQLRQSGGRASR